MVFSIRPRPPIPEPIGTDTGCVLFRNFKARILHGLNASDNSILNEGIHLALFFARDDLFTVKILY